MRFSKCTFLAFKDEAIGKNDTQYMDEEIKTFLKDYCDQFKRPLIHDLIDYYRLKNNPEIEMDGKILDQLGYHPFRGCGEGIPYASLHIELVLKSFKRRLQLTPVTQE